MMPPLITLRGCLRRLWSLLWPSATQYRVQLEVCRERNSELMERNRDLLARCVALALEAESMRAQLDIYQGRALREIANDAN